MEYANIGSGKRYTVNLDGYNASIIYHAKENEKYFMTFGQARKLLQKYLRGEINLWKKAAENAKHINFITHIKDNINCYRIDLMLKNGVANSIAHRLQDEIDLINVKLITNPSELNKRKKEHLMQHHDYWLGIIKQYNEAK